MRRLVRLFACGALLVLLLVPAAAGGSTPLAEQLAAALQSKKVRSAETGAVVYDLRTGRVVFALHAGQPLHPASNEKLGTTYAALTALGPSFRIETDVLGDGTQKGSKWQGDVVLKGYGDPTLSAADLRSLARQVARDGITRINGRVIGDESWFDARRAGAGWKHEFYLHESPALSALIVDRGWDGSEETQPALYAAQLFRRDLVDAGVSVRGPAQTGVASAAATALGYVYSPPVASLVRFMDVYSDNFTAEMLLKQVGAVQRGAGTAVAGARETRALLSAAGVPLSGVRIVDGSGLSLIDRWTAAGLADVLRRMWLDPDLRPYITTSLSTAGVNGTLEYRMRDSPAYDFVHAKTGTTDNASCLSGFVGGRFVFSVVENGNPVKTAAAERTQDAFAEVLARAAKSGF
ncbi:MAG TPA: D-alanyl-D-alanine carboxypeptidase [Gaiellaceae bacterium]|nr:D-alanyl-D-alanine carboxypeptidase [Gaiellaceae bacterium]